jgi:hypothetical protein
MVEDVSRPIEGSSDMKVINITTTAHPRERRIKWRPAVDGRGGLMEVQEAAVPCEWATVASFSLSASQVSGLIDAIGPNALAPYRIALSKIRVE